MSLNKDSNKKAEADATPAPPAQYLELEDQDTILLPNFDIVYLVHALSSPDVPEEDKVDMRVKLMDEIKSNKMLGVYETYCSTHKVDIDTTLVEEWKAYEEEETKMIIQAQKYSEENLGESEIRDQLMRRAHFLCGLGAYERAIEAYRIAFDKSVGVSSKLHVSLTIIRIGIAMKDSDLVLKEIKKAKDLLEKGGDWERRNKLKIYEGLHLISKGQFDRASKLLVNGLSTFSATELLPFKNFVLYGVCLAIISESRENYKKLILESPEVIQICVEDSVLDTFAKAFYFGDFKEGMISLMEIANRLKSDFFFGPHVAKYLVKTRIRCYKTFLQPFENVKISSMSARFGLPYDFIETEVSRFISSGHIPCRINRVEGIIHSYKENEVMEDKLLEHGDQLQTKIQKLSRIMFM
eukprot:GHVH01002563.1.p1 GENE.GHVH01002563.1~~GHVH01002563.1.p1  ORF type:complete len:410 (+),score=84.79 GHVH01002563.1:146-1375(+)